MKSESILFFCILVLLSMPGCKEEDRTKPVDPESEKILPKESEYHVVDVCDYRKLKPPPKTLTDKQIYYWKRVITVNAQILVYEHNLRDRGSSIHFENEKRAYCNAIYHPSSGETVSDDVWENRGKIIDNVFNLLVIRGETWYSMFPKLAESCTMSEPIIVSLDKNKCESDPVFLKVKSIVDNSVKKNSTSKNDPALAPDDDTLFKNLCDVLVEYTKKGLDYQSTAIERLNKIA